jgi:hypothetical protein
MTDRAEKRTEPLLLLSTVQNSHCADRIYPACDTILRCRQGGRCGALD